jgi:hypothetical protein
MLGLAAAVAAACVAGGVLVFLHHTHGHDTGRSVLGAGFITFSALSAIAGKAGGERDTPAGREVASRWLGYAPGYAVMRRSATSRRPRSGSGTAISATGRQSALMVVRSGGMIAKMAMRRQNRAEVVPGLGDEAFGGPGRLAARRGDEVVMLRLGKAAVATPPGQFLGLAQACVSRLPAHVT